MLVVTTNQTDYGNSPNNCLCLTKKAKNIVDSSSCSSLNQLGKGEKQMDRANIKNKFQLAQVRVL